MSEIRVVVADDHPVFRSGLRALIEDSPMLTCAGVAADGAEAVRICLEQVPDVVLMDVRMPELSGVDAIRQVLAAHPTVRVLVLTMLEDDTSLLACLRAGARGYVLKGATPEEIVNAVVTVADGHTVLGSQVAARITELATSGASTRAYPFPELTQRERDVLELLASGRSNSDIATRLALSEKTVRNNVSALFAKLRTADRAETIVRARDAGIAVSRP
jgi:DNA-binding NarL/FixJ family response regulator